MTHLTDKDIDYVAALAKLDLTDTEKKTYKAQLSEVITYIDELKEVDTDSIEPTSQTTRIENAYRQDTLQNSSLTVEEALSGTENICDNYVSVPLVLKERTL